MDINEIRRISREAKEAKWKETKEEIDIVWENKIISSIEDSITFEAKDGKDYVDIYIYDRFWDLGKVIISSEEEFSYILNLISEYFEDFKVETTYNDLISRRKIIISWTEELEDKESEEDDEELPF